MRRKNIVQQHLAALNPARTNFVSLQNEMAVQTNVSMQMCCGALMSVVPRTFSQDKSTLSKWRVISRMFFGRLPVTFLPQLIPFSHCFEKMFPWYRLSKYQERLNFHIAVGKRI